jgi:hypothetical protein
MVELSLERATRRSVLSACQIIFDVVGDRLAVPRQLKQVFFRRQDRPPARQVSDTWPLGPADIQANNACRTKSVELGVVTSRLR